MSNREKQFKHIPKKLIIVGAGGHGRVAADAASKSSQFNELYFVDDNKELSQIGKIKCIGTITSLLNDDELLRSSSIFIAIGDNRHRFDIYTKLKEYKAVFATIIHPTAVIGEDVYIDEGTAVFANAVINNGSHIGKGVIINTAATVDHDNEIDDFVHLSPGVHLAGNVHVCMGSWVGIGALIRNHVKIEGGSIYDPVMVGAGAVVIRSINESGTYVGVPAKKN